jgi:hypothetical protein
MASHLYPANRIVANPDISSSAAVTLTTIKVIHTTCGVLLCRASSRSPSLRPVRSTRMLLYYRPRLR